LKFQTISIGLFWSAALSCAAAHAGGVGDTVKPEIVFRTPSKNIFCQFDPNEQTFVCERVKPTYALVEAGNPISYEDVGLRKANKIDFVLAYGKSWKAPDGQITCWSKSSGLTCRAPDGRGFSLSKAAVKMIEP
jgi:hypothetical protein